MVTQRHDALPRSGPALSAAGILLILINLVFTPRIDFDAAYSVMAASPMFLWRQMSATFVALLLIYGSLGLYLRCRVQPSRVIGLALAPVFVGGTLLMCLEWGQAFIVHDLATTVPDALETLESQRGMSMFDLSAAIAGLVFAIGWMTFSLALLVTRAVPRLGPSLVIAGFIGLPVLAPLIGFVVGQVAASMMIGVGWVLLGRAPAGTA
jgi:hypothetical protein